VNKIIAGPYLTEMRQYGYRSVRLRGVTIDDGSEPGPSFNSQRVWNHVWDMIDDEQFPEPDDPGGRILYMVMMPPGVIPQAEGNPPGVPCGTHSDPLHHDFLVFDPERAWVGWVYFSPGGLNDITTVFTHELTEAISDPMVNDGRAWVMNRTINGGDENRRRLQ